MKAGILGLVAEGELDTVESHYETGVDEAGGSQEEVANQLEVTDEIQTHLGGSNGVAPYEGRAVKEEAREVETVAAGDGGIRHVETAEVVAHYTEFVAVPSTSAADGFAVTSTSDGLFVFDFLASMQPRDCSIVPAQIDLEGFYRDHENAIVHRYGWESDGEAETGVTWSENDVRQDEDLGELFNDGPPHPTQLGMTYADGLVRLVVTESGYIEIYAPSEMETTEFVELLIDDIIPHASPRTR